MSIARDLHTVTTSGLNHNFRDASGGTGGAKPKWRKPATPIQTPGRVLVSNPYSSRMRSDARQKDGKAGSSSARRASSSGHPPKRLKLDFQENVVSRYFDKEVSQRRQSLPFPSTSTSSHPGDGTADTIIIDMEDDAPSTSDKSHEPIVLKLSSPDPMDLIDNEISYVFDKDKPSPMRQFSSSYEETRKSPQDGESTQRLRNAMTQAEARTSESASRPAKALPSLLPRSASPAQTGTSSGQSNVQTKVALFERGHRDSDRHIDLRSIRQSRKNAMKPKSLPRTNVAPLPFQQRDVDATRPSGFVSGSKSPKGKAVASSVSVHLPLKEWSIGAAILPQEVTPESLSLVWEPENLKVRDADYSILFELQVKRGSLDIVKYVDIKKTTNAEPLIQIHPSVMAFVQNHSAYTFKPGSSTPNGFLTFKFDTSASDWDSDVYAAIVQQLVGALVGKDGKSILDGPAARAVWEAVTRVHENSSMLSDIEPMVVDVPKENSPSKSPSRPRARLRSRNEATTTADIFVRRSARLSGGAEPQHFSPRPDPDEVILGYRSGTGSLNITNGDVSRLNPGEFLNDTLIEFGLKLWLADLQESNPELASQVHVFSSFFYKKLSTKIPEEGYNSVRKWTSKFDLFQKKYIIVPINENLHWYLAIIYFPEYTLLPRPVQATNIHARRSTRHLGVIIDSTEAPQPEPAPEHPQNPPRSHPAELSSSDPQTDHPEQSNPPASAGESEGDAQISGIPPSTFYGTKQEQGEATALQSAPEQNSTLSEIEVENETIGNPESEADEVAEHPRTYIYTFDSLASKHPQAVKRLSRYLLMEAHDKKQVAEDTLTEPKGMQAIVPAQPNYCDCGIYLLHFAKTFMKDPKVSSDIICSRSMPIKGRRVPHEHWDGASVGSYRKDLATRILSMSEEWKKQRGEHDLGTKNQNQNQNQGQDQSDGAAAQEQPRGDQTPTASSKAENDDSDSDIEVLGSPQKVPPPSKAPRTYGGLAESRKEGPAARVRG